MKQENIRFILILVLIISVGIIIKISMVSASLGTFKQNECVNIRVLANCSSVNITEITSGSTTYNLNKPMQLLSGQTFNYTFCNTSLVGTYTYSWDNPCIDCSQGDCGNDFEITPSGFGRISSGGGITLFGFFGLMVVIGIVFFVVGFKVNNIVVKIGSISFSIIVFIMAILFMIVSIQQNLYGYENIIAGTETFWFVMKMLLTIGIAAFFIIIALILIKAWKIKRGYIDI